MCTACAAQGGGWCSLVVCSSVSDRPGILRTCWRPTTIYDLNETHNDNGSRQPRRRREEELLFIFQTQFYHRVRDINHVIVDVIYRREHSNDAARRRTHGALIAFRIPAADHVLTVSVTVFFSFLRSTGVGNHHRTRMRRRAHTPSSPSSARRRSCHTSYARNSMAQQGGPGPSVWAVQKAFIILSSACSSNLDYSTLYHDYRYGITTRITLNTEIITITPWGPIWISY